LPHAGADAARERVLPLPRACANRKAALKSQLAKNALPARESRAIQLLAAWGAPRAYAESLSRVRRLLRVLSGVLSLERSGAVPRRQDACRADRQDRAALRRHGAHAAAAAALHGARGNGRGGRQLLDLRLAAVAVPRARAFLGRRCSQRAPRPGAGCPWAAAARAAVAQPPAAQRLAAERLATGLTDQ